MVKRRLTKSPDLRRRGGHIRRRNGFEAARIRLIYYWTKWGVEPGEQSRSRSPRKKAGDHSEGIHGGQMDQGKHATRQLVGGDE